MFIPRAYEIPFNGTIVDMDRVVGVGPFGQNSYDRYSYFKIYTSQGADPIKIMTSIDPYNCSHPKAYEQRIKAEEIAKERIELPENMQLKLQYQNNEYSVTLPIGYELVYALLKRDQYEAFLKAWKGEE